MVNSIFQKHLCERSPRGWRTMSPLNKRLPWTEWGVSQRPTVLSKRYAPQPQSPTLTQVLKHPNKHFWLIFGGTNWKQITANGHQGLSPSCFLYSTFPDGDAVPSLPYPRWPGCGGGGSAGATPFQVHSSGPKWTLGFEWDFRTGNCSLGLARAISISKDNSSQLSGRAET